MSQTTYTTDKVHILKFGGTSLADADRIARAVDITIKRSEEVWLAVVVSALGGVTNELITLMDLALEGNEDWRRRFEHLIARHEEAANGLLSGERHQAVVQHLHAQSKELADYLSLITQSERIDPGTRDAVLSFGERFSCHIFTATMQERNAPAKAYESHQFIRTNANFGNADVDAETTRRLIKELFRDRMDHIPVITGFIGATAENQITTLGRSGSDYTAGIVGEALKAKVVEIWTDVDGVLTADPRLAPNAITIPQLNYSEMAEMAHFGAKVLHPRTVLPLEQQNIPILIKNSMNPDAVGTLITRDNSGQSGLHRSVTLKKDISVISVRVSGLDVHPQLQSDIIRALTDRRIPVFFVSSPSAELGITLAVKTEDAVQAREAIISDLEEDILNAIVLPPNVQLGYNLLTVIGDPRLSDGISTSAILDTLRENSVQVSALAKGLAHQHLSLLIHEEFAGKAVRLINDHYCVQPNTVRLFLAGVGTVGKELLAQLAHVAQQKLFRVILIGVCNSRQMTWDANGIPFDEIHSRLESGHITDWKFICDTLIRQFPYRTIFVDATGSAESARIYPELLREGIHITTPSKRANTFEQAFFDELQDLTHNKNTYFLYETTAGAGLPIIDTIKTLIRTGDAIQELSGVLSGTMTYVFQELESGKAFSEVIKQARELGYSEPDPRDDLSGEDVARKFLTLARVSGYKVEREECKVTSLVPEHLSAVSVQEFMERLPELDAYWQQEIDRLKPEGKVLRYVGQFRDGAIHIGPQAVLKSSPLGSLSGTDNQLAIYTRRYQKSPMIIQGPGAGKEVTAQGLLADILTIADWIMV